MAPEPGRDTGIIQYNQGNYDEALQAFDKAIEFDPFCANNRNSKGIVLHQMGRDKEAIKYFDQAIELNPRSAYAWYIKGKS